MSAEPSVQIRCRQIAVADLPAVAALLARGFPGRGQDYWRRGLERQAARSLPSGVPAFGYVLDRGGTLVGVILLLFRGNDDEGRANSNTLRCNLSSWYVDPDYRGYASLMMSVALRNKNATYINISPAPYTWSTVEAQGFTCYAARQFIAAPALFRLARDVTVRRVSSRDTDAVPEHDLLTSHADYGCISLLCTDSDGQQHPFVFVPMRAKNGRLRLPAVRLLYCRDVADFARCAGPLGRYLLARGYPLVVLDADGPLPGVAGLSLDLGRRKYFKGPQAPRVGDLAYTELALFGP